MAVWPRFAGYVHPKKGQHVSRRLEPPWIFMGIPVSFRGRYLAVKNKTAFVFFPDKKEVHISFVHDNPADGKLVLFRARCFGFRQDPLMKWDTRD